MKTLSLVLVCILGCSHSSKTEPSAPAGDSATEPAPPSSSSAADVLAVSVSGEAGSYTFAVELRSPDTGCEQYANWWEVLSPEGELLYRRILGHSHVDEQPFTRSGGPVSVSADTEVIVRAHMHPGGYGGRAMRGTVGGVFGVTELEAGFAANAATAAPQPDGCAF